MGRSKVVRKFLYRNFLPPEVQKGRYPCAASRPRCADTCSPFLSICRANAVSCALPREMLTIRLFRQTARCNSSAFLLPEKQNGHVLTVSESTYTVTDETSSGRRETAVKGLPEERTIRLAQYMIEQKATVRQTAARFGISKSTVHIEVMKMSGSFG